MSQVDVLTQGREERPESPAEWRGNKGRSGPEQTTTGLKWNLFFPRFLVQDIRPGRRVYISQAVSAGEFPALSVGFGPILFAADPFFFSKHLLSDAMECGNRGRFSFVVHSPSISLGV